MSRLSAIKESLSKLDRLNSEDTVGGDIKSLVKQTFDIHEQLVKCIEDLEKNAKLIEDLQNQEHEQSRIVRENREDMCKIMNNMKRLEKEVNMQKAMLDSRRQYQEYVAQELRQCASVEAALGQAMMDYLGLRLKLRPVDLENYQLQLEFQPNQSVCLLYNILDRTFDIQTIEPPHPAFDTIRKFLQRTGDISGLLYALQKYHFQNDIGKEKL